MGRRYPALSEGYPWQPYYPVVYGLASLPGSTTLSSWKVDVTAAHTAGSGCNGDKAWGSNREIPMGGEPLRVLGLLILLPLMGD